MATNETTGTFVAGFVIGGLIGTAIAYIFAPQDTVLATDTRRMRWRELNVRPDSPVVHRVKHNASISSDRFKQ